MQCIWQLAGEVQVATCFESDMLKVKTLAVKEFPGNRILAMRASFGDPLSSFTVLRPFFF